MEKIGLIGGSMFFGNGFLTDLEGKEVETEHGKVDVLVGENIVYLPRHGKSNSTPSHKINHRANIAALKELGVKKVIGINSVVSLRSKTRPSSIIIPKDFIDFNPVTFFDREIKQTRPCLDKDLKEKIIKIAKNEKITITNWEVYYQAKGPRFETQAEVNMIKGFAQIMGLTMASEATLAREMDLSYAALCSVDNYAWGIMKKELTDEQIKENKKKNTGLLKKLIEKLLEDLTKKEEKVESSGKIHDFIKSIRGG
ncbi:MAG: MTAP family purine nucleoside phosphorylase [Nanoarchaeota archaeon]|nr:MTAP family purine nucleoside phosphorylase [Nanoarchaeota archaeon]